MQRKEENEKYYTGKTSYRGVYYNISNSEICSLKNGMYFYFCSQAIKKKFDLNVDKFIDENKNKLEKFFPNTEFININMVLSIEYYIIIEKRGFRIETFNGTKIKRGAFIGDIEFKELNQEE